VFRRETKPLRSQVPSYMSTAERLVPSGPENPEIRSLFCRIVIGLRQGENNPTAVWAHTGSPMRFIIPDVLMGKSAAFALMRKRRTCQPRQRQQQSPPWLGLHSFGRRAMADSISTGEGSRKRRIIVKAYQRSGNHGPVVGSARSGRNQQSDSCFYRYGAITSSTTKPFEENSSFAMQV